MHVSRRVEFIEVVSRSRRPRDRDRSSTLDFDSDFRMDVKMTANDSTARTTGFATLSIRTLLLAVGVIAAYLGVFVSASREFGPYASVAVMSCLIVLLALVCALFSSVADDLWQDPDSTFVAALFGFLGYAVILVMGTVFPVAARFVDAGIAP